MSLALDRDEVIEISSDALRVAVRARRGARVTSVLSRHDNREWLRQARGGAEGSEFPYGSTFTDTNHYGWDEMFPTVDPCLFPTEPFQGAPVPDHGELWQLEWDVMDSSPSALHQRVSSDRFNYTFDRRLRVTDATLRCEYECVVDTDVPVPMLWALHPQFEMHVGSRVTLAREFKSVLDTSDAAAVYEVDWLGNLQVERDVLDGADRMIYLKPDEEANAVSIIDLSGSFLTLSWDNQFAPYLGIWLDRGRYTQGSVAALEPTNGFFDDLARAYGGKSIRYFEPGEATSWWVEITVGGDTPWTSS
jgi:galactose mutarotase-like enzyme